MIRLLSLFAAAALIAAPAFAQSDETSATDRENAVKFWEYSKCVADRRKWQVESVLSHPKNTAERRKETRQLAKKSSACLRSNMKVSSGPYLLNNVTAAYVHQKFHGKQLPDVSAVPAMYKLSSLSPEATEKRMLQMAMHQFAECVVRAAPSEAVALLGVKPFSSEEETMIDTLRPAMGGCLPVQRGAKLGFVRTDLRAVLGKVANELFAASESQEKPDA